MVIISLTLTICLLSCSSDDEYKIQDDSTKLTKESKDTSIINGSLKTALSYPQHIQDSLTEMYYDFYQDKDSDLRNIIKFKNLKILRIRNSLVKSDASIDSIVEICKLLPKLRELELENCLVDSIPYKLTELRKLNSLSIISEMNTIDTVLYIIHSINQNFVRMESLNSLSFRNCIKNKIPKIITSMQNLRRLSFSNCDILSLEGNWNEMLKLNNLSIIGAPNISLISKSFSKLLLDSLWIMNSSTNNNSMDIICEIKNLKILGIVGSKLNQIPAKIVNLSKLEHLAICFNDSLQYIDPNIKQLKNLKTMYYSSDSPFFNKSQIEFDAIKSNMSWCKFIECE